MFKGLIEKYINNLTKNDITNFAKTQGINLNQIEIDTIYNELKNNLNNVLYNTDIVLSKIKDKLQPTTYLKIIELINYYKRRYANYL